MLSVVNAVGTTETSSLIDDIVREGARRMLAAALEAEVNAYIAELADQRDEHGHRQVVRNGLRAEVARLDEADREALREPVFFE